MVLCDPSCVTDRIISWWTASWPPPQSLYYISTRPRSGGNQCKHIFMGLTL